MTAVATTTTGVRPSSAGIGSAVDGVRLRPVRSRRRPAALLAAIALVVVGATVVAVAFEHAGALRPVLATRTSLAAGSVVPGDALRVVDVHVPAGVPVEPPSAAGSIIGRRLANAVPAGALLSPGDLATGPAVEPGSALVGVAVQAGQLPSSGVLPGQAVDVVSTGGAGGQASPAGLPPAGTVVVVGAQVVASAAGPPSGSIEAVVTLAVPSTEAATVAALSASDGAALVVVAPT